MSSINYGKSYDAAQTWLGCPCLLCAGSEETNQARFDWNALEERDLRALASPTSNEFGSVSYLSGDFEVDSLSYGLKWNPNTNREITFSFVDNDSYFAADYSQYNENLAVHEPTDEFKHAVREALKLFENVIDVSFVEVEETSSLNGVLRYGITDNINAPAWALPPYNKWLNPADLTNYEAYHSAGDIWFNSNRFLANEPNPGNYEFSTILHETGHALGLKHPHEAFTNELTSEVFPSLDESKDSLVTSVMTYRDFFGDNTNGYNSNYFPTSLMPLDITTLQHLYGSNVNYNSTDSMYSWSANTPILETIFDNGGIDTINFENLMVSVHSDLRGHSNYTTVGNFDFFDVLYFSGQSIGAIIIDKNSTIENLYGGQADDFLIGNSVDNLIKGNGGDDVICAVTGTDTLWGGSGADTFVCFVDDTSVVIEDFEDIDNFKLILFDANTDISDPSSWVEVAQNDISHTTNSDGSDVYSYQTSSVTIKTAGSVISPLDSDVTSNLVSELSFGDGSVGDDYVGVTAYSDGAVSYALVDAAGDAADADGRFKIGETSGVVTVADYGLIDFEYAQSHVITVEATGTDGSKAYSDFTIGVEDEDEPLRVDVISRSGDDVTFGVYLDSAVFDGSVPDELTNFSFVFSFDPDVVEFAGTVETDGSIPTSAVLNADLSDFGNGIYVFDQVGDGVKIPILSGSPIISHVSSDGSGGIKDTMVVTQINASGTPTDFDIDTYPIFEFDMTLLADVDAVPFYTPNISGYTEVKVDPDGGLTGDELNFGGFTSVQDFSEQVITGTIVDALDGSVRTDVDVYVAQTAADTNVYIHPVAFGSEMVFEVNATSDVAVSTLSFDVNGSDPIGFVEFGPTLLSQGLDGVFTAGDTSGSGSMTFSMNDGSDVIAAGETVKLVEFKMGVGGNTSNLVTLSDLLLGTTAHEEVTMTIDMVQTDAAGVYSTSVGSGKQSYLQAVVDDDGRGFAADVNLTDAIDVLKIFGQQYTANNEMLVAADIDRDGSVGLFDAINILKSYAQITTPAKPGWQLLDNDTFDESIVTFDIGQTDYNSMFDLGEVSSQKTLDLNAILVGDVNVWI